MVEVVPLTGNKYRLNIINSSISVEVYAKDLDAWMLGYPSNYCFPYLKKEEQDALDNTMGN